MTTKTQTHTQTQTQIDFFALPSSTKKPPTPSYPHFPQDDSGSENSKSPRSQEDNKDSYPYIPPKSFMERATGKIITNNSNNNKPTSKKVKFNVEASSSKSNSDEEDDEHDNSVKDQDEDDDESEEEEEIIKVGEDYCRSRIDVKDILGIDENPVVIAKRKNPKEGEKYLPINGLFSLLRGVKVRGEKGRSASPFWIKGLNDIKIYLHSVYHEMFNCEDFKNLRIREKRNANVKRLKGNKYERSEEMFNKLKSLYTGKNTKPKVISYNEEPTEEKDQSSDDENSGDEISKNGKSKKGGSNSSRSSSSSSHSPKALKKRKTESEGAEESEDSKKFVFRVKSEEWRRTCESLKDFEVLFKSGKIPARHTSFILDSARRYFDNATYKFKHKDNVEEITKILKTDVEGESDSCYEEL